MFMSYGVYVIPEIYVKNPHYLHWSGTDLNNPKILGI
jgi:hypothetical protein